MQDGGTTWLRFQFSTEYTIGSYSFFGGGGNWNRHPTKWQLYIADSYGCSSVTKIDDREGSPPSTNWNEYPGAPWPTDLA